MLFSKPYPMDFRRPANAEEILDTLTPPIGE
jgi:hypothetical protein